MRGPDAALGDCACKDEYIQLLIFVLGAEKQTNKPSPAETMLTTVVASPAFFFGGGVSVQMMPP